MIVDKSQIDDVIKKLLDEKLYMQQKKKLENSNTEKYIAHIITKR